MVVANYLVDTLPADAFRVRESGLFEGRVRSTVSSMTEEMAGLPSETSAQKELWANVETEKEEEQTEGVEGEQGRSLGDDADAESKATDRTGEREEEEEEYQVPLTQLLGWAASVGPQASIDQCRTRFAWQRVKKLDGEKVLYWHPPYAVKEWDSYLGTVRDRMLHVARSSARWNPRKKAGERLCGVKETPALANFDRSFVFPTAALRCMKRMQRWSQGPIAPARREPSPSSAPSPSMIQASLSQLVSPPSGFKRRDVSDLLRHLIPASAIARWLARGSEERRGRMEPGMPDVGEGKGSVGEEGSVEEEGSVMEQGMFLGAVTDKGHCDLRSVVHDCDTDSPYIARHGSISFSVHFDVFRHVYEGQHNGFFFQPTTPRR